MLKKFDIVAFRTPGEEILNLGVVKKNSKEQETKVEIAILGESTPDDNTEWIVTELNSEIEKSTIAYKITENKIVGKRSKFGKNFRVEFKGYDVGKILEEKDLDKNEEIEESGTQLKKRKRGKKQDPLKIRDCYEAFQYGEVGSQNQEAVKSRVNDLDWKRHKKMLPSFMRTATTNLRFELPDITGDLGNTPEPNKFRNALFKSERHTILKTLSQDLNLSLSFLEEKQKKFIDVCQSVLKEIDDRYGDKLDNPLNLEMVNRSFVSVPSKKEMNQTLDYFSNAIDYLSENVKGDTEGLLYLIMSNIFFFSLRFFMSHENSKLHLLKNKMFLDNYENEEKEGISRLKAMYSSLIKFVKKIKNLLTEEFEAEYLDLQTKNSVLIGNCSEEIIDSDDKLDTKTKKNIKKFLANEVIRTIEELMITERSESKIIPIFVSVLKNVNFNNINFALSGKQTMLARRLNTFYNDKMNHTNKRWNLFVDSCCEFIRQNRIDHIKEIQKDRTMIDALTRRMLSIQTSVAKGLYLSALRVVLDEQVKKTTEGEGFDQEMNHFLNSLLDTGDKLPIFIYFVQNMSRIHGDIEDLAKTKNIQPLENFVQKFMFDSGTEQAENLKYVPQDYQEYIETKNRLFFILSNDKDDSKIEFIKEALLKVNLSEEEEAAYFEDKLSNFDKRNLAWAVFINEFFTSYLSEEKFEHRDKLIEVFEVNKEELLQNYSKPQVKFLSQILHNFGGNSILSLSPKNKKDELNVKMIIVNTLTTLILTNHKLLGKFNDEVDNHYVKRGQLSALPGEAEEKYLLIANTFYSVDSNWRSGQQFTKLYKCSCGYLYWIGDCGRAWVIGECPGCKKKIGGTSHNLVNQDNVEITKATFFDEMYGPLEEISGKIYQVRSLDGKYKKLGTEEKMIEEKNEGKMEEEGMEEADNVEEKAKPRDDYIPIRSMDKECHFLLVEFISHCRYLLDFLIEGEDYQNKIKDFIELSNGEYFQYFYDLLYTDYFRIKEIEFRINKEQYFKGMMLFFREDLLNKLEHESDSNRNKTENLVTKLFDLVKPNFSNNVLSRIEMKKDLDGNLSNSSKLVKDWVNRIASISELKKKNSDIKVISAMRTNTDIDMEKLKEFLNSRLQIESAEGGNKETEAQIKFLMNVIGLEPILLIFKQMLYSHIDFCNYLEYLFDFRLTYKMACNISIHDLITQDPIEDDQSETDEEFKNLRRAIIERNKNDITISSKFHSLQSAWKNIMKYREEYGDLFDFRFLCHATEMPQEKIDEILSEKTAKLIFFLPNENYAESLFMTSALQTIGNIQNKLIKDSKREFFRANYSNPVKICVQDAKKSDLIGMSNKVKEVIKKCSYVNLSFNKDEELVYNIDMMDREVAIDLFFGRKKVSFEGDFIKNFNFSREFTNVANYVTAVSHRFGQTFLDEAERKHLFSACDYDIEETFCIFGRKLKELGEKKFDLALINAFSDKKEEFKINFEYQYYVSNNQSLTADEKEQTVVDHLNKANITLNNVRYVYEIIETRMYELGVSNLDPHLRVELTEELKEKTKESLKKLTEIEKVLVLRVAKAMVLRQLVKTTNENIGKAQLKMYLEYSDALSEEEEINSEFLESLPDELQMHHLPEFVDLF